jgi:hypothetical protein
MTGSSGLSWPGRGDVPGMRRSSGTGDRYCFAPDGCPVIIRSLSSPARRVIAVLGTDDIENLRRFTAGPGPRGRATGWGGQ